MNTIERTAQKGMEVLSEQFNNQQLIADFQAVVNDAEALLKATAGQGNEKLTELRTKAEESLKVAKARMIEAQEAVLTRTKAAAKATDTYVHANPWKAIGAAAGVGVVVGLLIGRR